jgi:hypothetical protein
LRYGAKELFAEEGDEAGKSSRQIHYDDVSIDRCVTPNAKFPEKPKSVGICCHYSITFQTWRGK